MITDEQRAGHALRARGAKLAEAVVAEQYRVQPDLAQRYGPEGRRYCVRDVGYHIDFLAASVELSDVRRFVDYVAWAKGVMAAYGIPPGDFLVSLRVMRDVVATTLTPAAADVVCRHIDAALPVCQS